MQVVSVGLPTKFVSNITINQAITKGFASFTDLIKADRFTS